jgi:hypothetical protein
MSAPQKSLLPDEQLDQDDDDDDDSSFIKNDIDINTPFSNTPKETQARPVRFRAVAAVKKRISILNGEPAPAEPAPAQRATSAISKRPKTGAKKKEEADSSADAKEKVAAATTAYAAGLVTLRKRIRDDNKDDSNMSAALKKSHRARTMNK